MKCVEYTHVVCAVCPCITPSSSSTRLQVGRRAARLIRLHGAEAYAAALQPDRRAFQHRSEKHTSQTYPLHTGGCCF